MSLEYQIMSDLGGIAIVDGELLAMPIPSWLFQYEK